MVFVFGSPKLNGFMFIPASVMSKWRPSLLGVSFQSAMLINWPLMRQPLTPPKTANYGEEENNYMMNNELSVKYDFIFNYVGCEVTM